MFASALCCFSIRLCFFSCFASTNGACALKYSVEFCSIVIFLMYLGLRFDFAVASVADATSKASDPLVCGYFRLDGLRNKIYTTFIHH